MWDYDNIDIWGPLLRKELATLFPNDVEHVLANAAPEWMDDACAILLDQLLVPRETLTAALENWIESQEVAAYHGTRLNSTELADVRRNGLRRLVATDRETRLRRTLSRHPRWSEVDALLADVIVQESSHREGQVHATITRAGLVDGYNHYLRFGSELDRNIACALLGDEGLCLLGNDGEQYVIKLAVPGAEALRANDPYDFRQDGFVDIFRHMLHAWAYWLANPGWQCSTQEIDCGLVFFSDVPAKWIVSIDLL